MLRDDDESRPSPADRDFEFFGLAITQRAGGKS